MTDMRRLVTVTEKRSDKEKRQNDNKMKSIGKRKKNIYEKTRWVHLNMFEYACGTDNI